MRVKQVFRKGLQSSLIVLMAAGSLHVGAADSYYRWLDSRGNTVLSDRPPSTGVDYEVVSTQSGLKRVVPGEQGAVPREIESRVGNDFEAVPRTTSPPARKNPEICAIATKNLETLTNYARVETRDDQGERRFLTAEERQAEIVRAQESVSQHCD